MRIRNSIMILPLLGLMAACDGGQEKTYVNTASGESATLRTGGNVAAPKNLPDFAPIYPGARIESTLDGVGSDTTGGQAGGMVTFRTDDDPETVADFYRRSLERSNLTNRNEARMNGGVMLTGGHAEDADRGLQVSIGPDTDGPGSFVTLVYSLGGG